LNVVTVACVPGCVGGVPLIIFVPLSTHATPPTDGHPATANPAGPVIVGVLYSVADNPFGCRKVTTVLRYVVP
jgi:hypothetical protein